MPSEYSSASIKVDGVLMTTAIDNASRPDRTFVSIGAMKDGKYIVSEVIECKPLSDTDVEQWLAAFKAGPARDDLEKELVVVRAPWRNGYASTLIEKARGERIIGARWHGTAEEPVLEISTAPRSVSMSMQVTNLDGSLKQVIGMPDTPVSWRPTNMEFENAIHPSFSVRPADNPSGD